MLSSLQIKNYALIEELDISFDQGFSIITGETGAGKSILLGALSLILGQRADTNVLRDSSSKAVIEGTFEIESYQLEWFFEKHQLDHEFSTIIRREISPAGKSRAFINDTPVNLQQLKELGGFLVDIHSQHQTLQLNEVDFQLNVIDAMAGQMKARAEYVQVYSHWKRLKQELDKLLEEEHKARQDQDYFQFQLQELTDANLIEGEQAAIESELSTVQHAEEIKTVLFQVLNGLSERDENVLSELNLIANILTGIVPYNKELEELLERLQSTKLELEDIATELEQKQNEVDFEPEKLEQLNDRIDLIYKLQRKHNVNTIENLISLQNELEEKVSGVDTLSERILALQIQIQEVEIELKVKAQRLSKNRQSAFQPLEKQVKELLSQLGMHNATLKVSRSEASEPDKSGIDKIKFLFSANTGMELREIGKVASGGELSRLMLSLKAILAKLVAMPTIIFDEIDTGVSGDIASKMAIILKEMSTHMQIVSITHLPQVAAKGDHHYKVFKADKEGKTYSHLIQLTNDDRLDELARMLSGEAISEAAIENARDLMRGY